MKSNELKEILNKTRRTKDISLSVEQVEELIKKLEVLEILEKGIFKVEKTQTILLGNFYKSDVLVLKYCIYLNKEEKKLIEGWLDGKD